jgi:RNA polymerase sigma-70 factor (ECF subfamily)
MTTTVEAPEVVIRAQAGDTSAIAELYREHRRFVFMTIYASVGNQQVAEDLTADVFVRLIRKVDLFEWRGTDIRAWLRVIARNIVTDRFKSGRYKYETAYGTPETFAHGEAPDREAKVEAFVTDRLTAELVIRMMDELSDDQREVLRLRFLCEMSIEETAAAMGREEGAIKALQYRAVRAMRKLYPDGSPL